MISPEILKIHDYLKTAYPDFKIELEDPADFSAKPELDFYPEEESGTVMLMLGNEWAWPGASKTSEIIGVMVFIDVDDGEFVVDNEWLMHNNRIPLDNMDLVYIQIDEIMNMYINPTKEIVKSLLDEIHSLNTKLISIRMGNEDEEE